MQMTHYAHIENEQAYEAAIARRIKANARKSAIHRWYAQHADAHRLQHWLNATGEFAGHTERDPRCVEVLDQNDELSYVDHNENAAGWNSCNCKWVANPVTKFNNSPFLVKLRDQLCEWGSLSEKQTQAVRDSLARAEGFIVKNSEERERRLTTDRASSQHVGTVGERREFDLTVERTFSFDGQFGTTYINICRDADQNVIVYKGSKPFEREAQLRVKATIKAHDLRDEVAQTLISRPTIIQA
jgi:hypothetical protein